MSRVVLLVLFGSLTAWCGQVGSAAAEAARPPAPQQEGAPAPGPPKGAADPVQMAAPAGKPVQGAVPNDLKDFIIGAEDVLFVRVWREAELSGQFVVRPDGKISLPLVNEVVAAGSTPEQLKATIVQGLQKYMNNPEVSISVVQVNSRKYYIQGEVGRPGAYPLVVPTRVLEALVNAGGFKEFANTKKIYILRKGERLRFNYKDVTRGKHAEQNIFLEPGDQIIVN